MPGILISEHLPKLAKQMKDIAIIRSMSTKEGDHGRATFNLRTGYQQTGPIRYPTLGSLVAKELGRDDAELPNFVSIAPVRAFNPGCVRTGLPRAAVRPAGRRRARRARPPRRHRRAQPLVQGGRPEPAAGRGQPRGPTPGSGCWIRCARTSCPAIPGSAR